MGTSPSLRTARNGLAADGCDRTTNGRSLLHAFVVASQLRSDRGKTLIECTTSEMRPGQFANGSLILNCLTSHHHTLQSVVMAPIKPIPLSPTLWRTCRALANRKRLLLLRHVISAPNVSVSATAQALGMPLSVASQYLRILNARGLLQAKRQRRQVLYEVSHDPSLPETRILLEALQRTFQGRANPFEKAFQALTAFTHPRRIILVRAVAAGADNLKSIRVKTGISSNAALRHLKKLRQRGYVAQRADTYKCLCPAEPLAKALMGLVLRTR